MRRLRATRVRVPCSTSNLGAGFDTLGLALDRYLRAIFTPGAGRLQTSRHGTVADLKEPPEEDLLAATFVRTLGEAGAEARGMLTIHSDIPVARGLGSSAAAVLAGYELARSALGAPCDPDGAFRTAYRSDGHGDNAAPCLFGGLCAVVPDRSGPRPLPLPLSPRIGFAYAAPSAGISTAAARAVLPAEVPHAVAVEELGRLTALLRGLAEGDPELIQIGMQDRLHVPHRLPLIESAYDAIEAGGAAGAWAVTISGSGSGLLALCDPLAAKAVAAAMHEVLSRGADDPGSAGLALKPDRQGLVREESDAG